MQNAHTRNTAYMFFFVFYNWSTKNGTESTVFQNKPKPNQTRVFSQNWTELEKSIPHIPSLTPTVKKWNEFSNVSRQVNRLATSPVITYMPTKTLEDATAVALSISQMLYISVSPESQLVGL